MKLLLKTKLTLLTCIFGFSLVGCYPDGADFVEDYDVVLTRFEDKYDFSSKNTYARPSKIVKITGNIQDGEDPKFIPDATAALILARIDENMQSLGWSLVEISENPDLLLTPASLETTTLYYYYDYWYWWWGGYYPGWGYPPYYVSSYTTGTLIMALVDPTLEGANGNPIPQWTGALNGILTNSYDGNRINTLIDKAFMQSPYLKTN
ncbi:DUF4136 domain-containing protein [Algoriphagus resistens]|uniref:DUF4136 domain-containing protein n=1 Tax=Algoriphagus resistens TaxID=1750590 RepID=UPI000716901C|nr:DUF4136 domain-containing protein [Algoriphagus resistens]